MEGTVKKRVINCVILSVSYLIGGIIYGLVQKTDEILNI